MRRYLLAMMMCGAALAGHATGFEDFLKSKTFTDGLKAYEMTLNPDKLEGLLSRNEAEAMASAVYAYVPDKNNHKQFGEIMAIIKRFRSYPFSVTAASQFALAVESLRNAVILTEMAVASRMPKDEHEVIKGVIMELRSISIKANSHAFILTIWADTHNVSNSHPLGPIKVNEKIQKEMKAFK